MANSDSLLGTTLEEYRLESLLGQGGMARVYRGIDTRLNRYVAIKVIDKQFRDDSEYARRFQLEAQAIAQLEHPHIVSLYRYGAVQDVLYIAMQYIEGADVSAALEQYEQNGDFIAPSEALQIIRQTGQALDYVHERGIIHRDIKPNNIMLDKDGRAILTDFGLALMTDVGTRGEIFGTPHYLSPEQAISSASVVPQSDIYSLGVIAYRMFTGQVPFEAAEPLDIAMMHMSETPPHPQSLRADISDAVADVLLTALIKEPSTRYQSGKDLADALEEALQTIQKPASAPRMTIPQLVKNELSAHPLPPVPVPVDKTPRQKTPEQVSITDRLADTAEHIAEPTARNQVVHQPTPAPRMTHTIAKVEEKSTLATYLPYAVVGIIVAMVAIFGIFSLANPNEPAEEVIASPTPLLEIFFTGVTLHIEANSNSALIISNRSGATMIDLDSLQFDNSPQGGSTVIANWSGGRQIAPNECVVISTISTEFNFDSCNVVDIYDVGSEIAIWDENYAVSYLNDLNETPIMVCMPNSLCEIPIRMYQEDSAEPIDIIEALAPTVIAADDIAVTVPTVAPILITPIIPTVAPVIAPTIMPTTIPVATTSTIFLSITAERDRSLIVHNLSAGTRLDLSLLRFVETRNDPVTLSGFGGIQLLLPNTCIAYIKPNEEPEEDTCEGIITVELDDKDERIWDRDFEVYYDNGLNLAPVATCEKNDVCIVELMVRN